MKSDSFCFCTLAVGDRYRIHANFLIQDLCEYAPNIPIFILTDKPDNFKKYPQVIAIEHKLQSVVGFHDKRFVFEKGLEMFDICTFLDSDVRVLGPVPNDMDWPPGITARYGCPIMENSERKSQNKLVPLIKEVSQKLDIDLNETKRFHEFMFTLKKQSGIEKEFLELWRVISYFFELGNVYHGSGSVMGLAAAKSGLQVHFDTVDRFPFFKDNIESIRISKGESSPEDKYNYFEKSKQIEFPSRSFLQETIYQVSRKSTRFFRLLKLKHLAMNDSRFRDLFYQDVL